MNAQGAEQARIDKAARIVEKIRNVGYIPPQDNRYPELRQVRRAYDFAVKNRIRDVTGGEPGGEYGLFWGGGFEQLGIQVVGLLAIIGWSAAFAAVTFGLMRLIGWYAFVENSWTIPLA